MKEFIKKTVGTKEFSINRLSWDNYQSMLNEEKKLNNGKHTAKARKKFRKRIAWYSNSIKDDCGLQAYIAEINGTAAPAAVKNAAKSDILSVTEVRKLKKKVAVLEAYIARAKYEKCKAKKQQELDEIMKVLSEYDSVAFPFVHTEPSRTEPEPEPKPIPEPTPEPETYEVAHVTDMISDKMLGKLLLEREKLSFKLKALDELIKDYESMKGGK